LLIRLLKRAGDRRIFFPFDPLPIRGCKADGPACLEPVGKICCEGKEKEMRLPETFRFPHMGWLIWHLIAIPLVFF
jgi:hypothetical protein